MKVLIPLALFVALLLWYAIHGREWLKTKPWAQGFFELVEPVEIVLFKKSETILFARLLSGLGVVLTMLQQFDGVDLTPILPFIPDAYKLYVTVAINSLPMLISGLGYIVERLRNRTTKPIELVSVPDKVVAESPKLTEAVAMADATKTEAVAAVAQAKAA